LNRGIKTLPIHVLEPVPFCTVSSTKLQFVVLFNPLNAELNLICHLLALLGAHPILHVSRVRVKGKFINATNLPHSNNFKDGRKKRTVPFSCYCSV
jgi:hypothetical protein